MIGKFFKGFTIDKITQGFHDGHPALDIVNTYGTPLCSAEDGHVMGLRGDGADGLSESLAELAYGYGIRIKGDSGDEYLYWHCMPMFPVSAGDRVTRGQIIAYMGNSGHVVVNGVDVPVENRLDTNHPGTHLHIEYTHNGVRIDPLPLIDWSLEPNYSKLDVITATVKVVRKIVALIGH